MSDPELAYWEFTIKRVLDAPREKVWEFWTDPERIARWWGPRGFTTPVDSITIELRPGGTFGLTMVSEDGDLESKGEGYIREIAEPERIVWAEPESDLEGIDNMVATVTFADLGDGRTELTLHVRIRTTREIRDDAVTGWGSMFDRLAEQLVAT